MDANGTRFHLLLGQDDWASCSVIWEDGVRRLVDLWHDEASAPVLRTLGWDRRRSELMLPARGFQFTKAPRDVAPRLANRRGAGGDPYGNWYWIDDAERAVLVRSAGSEAVTELWAPDRGVRCDPPPARGGFHPVAPVPPVPTRLRGLAVTSEHYLVVGTIAPAGLLIFDLHAGGPPTQVVWPVAFAPFDFAPATDGGLWLLDRALEGGPARLWRLDRRLDVVRWRSEGVPAPGPSVFRPVGSPGLADSTGAETTGTSAPPTCLPVGQVSLDDAFPLPAGDFVAVEGLPDGTALLLDNADDGERPRFSRVWRYLPADAASPLDGPLSTRSLLSVVDAAARSEFSLLGHDFAFLPDEDALDEDTAPADGAARRPVGLEVDPDPTCPDQPPRGRLLLVSSEGNQAFAFDLALAAGRLVLRPLAEYWPMRLFTGQGLVASAGQAFYPSRGHWIPVVEQPRPRHALEWQVFTPVEADPARRDVPHAFDGGEPDCVWHRLMLDGCIPPESAVEVWSRTANAERDLLGQQWQREPNPYRRGDGAELPFARPAAGDDDDTWELLFQRARGRYLQLRLVLRGDGRGTPRLRALRAYYPRFSYLRQYLPAVYREEPDPASFLDRFLANPEGLYTALEDRIAAVQVLFDVRTTPAEYLDWLASWFGAMLDPHWDQARRRLFVAHAPDLFRQRGTVRGLIRMIRLATDPCPDESIFADDARRPSPIRVVEQFQTRRVPAIVFGDPTVASTPELVVDAEWTPRAGPGPLHDRYREYLRGVYGSVEALGASWDSVITSFDAIDLPPIEPAGSGQASDWRRFLRQGLGFPYAPATAADAPAFRAFLARRYGTIGALNRAYGLTDERAHGRFADVALPEHLPTDATSLRDWIQFVSIALLTATTAHHFTVLVPVVDDSADDRGAYIDRVRRVVELEKPAHTIGDVKEYWAAFRVGEARLGFDSLLDRGTRLGIATLGHSYLAGAYLAPHHPWALRRRQVVGRDRAADTRPL